jgi:hypothetical protein
MTTLTKLPLLAPSVSSSHIPPQAPLDEPLVEQHFGGLSDYQDDLSTPVAERAADCIARHPFLATTAALAAGIFLGSLVTFAVPAIAHRRRPNLSRSPRAPGRES